MTGLEPTIPVVHCPFKVIVCEAKINSLLSTFQTVLEEVKHRSSPVFKRLRDIIDDSKRRFYIFINEHHVVSVCCICSASLL